MISMWFHARPLGKTARYSWREALRAAAFAMVLSAELSAPTPGAAATTQDGATYTFAFQDAQIAQVAQEILGDLGLGYTIDPSVTGRMSFRIDRRLTRAQLLQAFEAALAANGVSLVRDGEQLIVTATSKARTSASVRGAGEAPRGVGYEVVAVPVSYAIPTEVAKALEAIAGKGAVLYADDKLGLIILGGNGADLRSALETLKVFDQSGLQSARIRWYELSQAPAAMVADELESLLKAGGAGGVSVVPLKRLNGLIVFGRTPQALEEVGQWIARLDVPTKDSASSLWVYHPRNTSAEALSRTLNSLNGIGPTSTGGGPGPLTPRVAPASLGAAGQQTTGLGMAPAASADALEDLIRTAVDPESNTLLVSAPAWRWVKLQKILAELDRPQAQIMIEASIVEVTLGRDFRLGVDFAVLDGSGKVSITSNARASGSVGATYPGFSVAFLGNDVQAALNALGARTSIEVVSAPKLLTLDNHTARLEVGDQIPIVTQSAQSTSGAGSPLVNSVTYRNSGVILSVTPRISGDDRIVLDVSQEVSSAVRTQSSDIDSPTIQQRRLESTLVLTDGGVVALGGLISNTKDRGDSGIPGFQDIPLLGSLFKTQTRNDKRTELIVLLTARIIRDAGSADRAMADLYADLQEIRRRGLIDAPRP